MGWEIVPFAREHLAGVMALFEAERWPSYVRDAERTHTALTAPGSVCLVAVEEGDGAVVGVIHVQSDGVIQAHLSTMAVAAGHRRRGIGTALLREAMARAGGERLDLISIADAFYAALSGDRRLTGFRVTRQDLGLGRGAGRPGD